MASSAYSRPRFTSASADELAEELERLRAENRQLKQALASHAVVDQAIGVLTVLGQISPSDGFTVLREVSQHTNIKLAQVAEQVLKHAQGAALPDVLLGELHAALARHATDSPPG
ncbi:ANTAR domain-containing protein [Streptomyces cynarae]|uniref:ANTAR domain-containing protein n=1 Tax=Streptomyces cynarae TaxID=2981134 RepID=A0ABY6EDK9_9ACTN|nr:ANTAR domain-containing protein [Streptomyces cynarae]UXY24257.1 ANTAR domain-containing protein [Streptomyces cynarae]